MNQKKLKLLTVSNAVRSNAGCVYRPSWNELDIMMMDEVDAKSNSWFEERGQLERRGSPSRASGEEMRVNENGIGVVSS